MTGFLHKQSAPLQLITLFGFFVAFFLIYAFFIQFALPAISGGYTLLELLDAIRKNPGLVVYLKLAQFLYTFIVFLLPPALFIYLSFPQPLDELGANRAPGGLNMLLSVLIMLAAIPLVGYLMEWNQTWNVGEALRKLEEQAGEQTKLMLAANNSADIIVNLLVVAVIPAIAEELLFRGALQQIFIRMLKRPWLAIIITSILFSAIHGQFLGFVPRFVLSLLMGYIYYISGNIWLPILAHFVNNGLSVVLISMNVEENSDATPWYLALISGMVVVALFLLMYRRNKSAEPIKL